MGNNKKMGKAPRTTRNKITKQIETLIIRNVQNAKVIYYKHDVYAKRTFAIALPEYAILAESLSSFLRKEEVPLKLLFGVARVHPQDNFRKDVGRTVAKENMEPVKFLLKEITIEKNKLLITIENDDYMLRLSSLKKKNSYRLHIVRELCAKYDY